MSPLADGLRQTDHSKLTIVARLVAGLPLLVIGASHFADPAPFVAMLEAAGIPLVGFNAIAAPLAEVLAGVLLLAGLLARLGGLLGASTMVVALYAHLAVNPASLPEGVTMPPIVLPLAVLAGAVYVAWRGAGAFSLDARSHATTAPGETRTPPT